MKCEAFSKNDFGHTLLYCIHQLNSPLYGVVDEHLSLSYGAQQSVTGFRTMIAMNFFTPWAAATF
jgi:hypothetical protein